MSRGASLPCADQPNRQRRCRRLVGHPAGEVIVVDYKATAKDGEVNIDADWQMAYKRQMEIYQWLVRGQNLTVSDTGYFVYCNGQDAEAFDSRIEFAVKLELPGLI
jgi:hypothetical protein